MTDLVMLVGIGLKTSLVVIAASLLSLGLRRQAAAFSHVLWTAALALCVLMPLAIFLLPSHEIIALPSAPTLPLPRARGREWEGAIVALWLVGSCLVLLRELIATIGLARWRRLASPLTSVRWVATFERISAAQGFDQRSLRVLESEHIASPCTWGVMRPVLLLPAAGDAWPEAARSAALMHELAHVQRRDAVTSLVVRSACVLHWYNPLVWLAAERIRSLQERACDDAVLRAGTTPSDYAQFLLDVAAHTNGVTRFARASIGMTHESSLRARIVAILDPQATRSRPRRIRVVAACTPLFVFTIFLATLTVAVEAPPPAKSPPPQTPALTETPTLPELPAMPETPVPPELPVPPVPPSLPTTPVPPIPPVDPSQ
jgi:beta-lactamase regulating signal transducer with metallopeptidase domain